jgi:putative membrane-bound dehydrogenase-like protein
MAGTELGRNRGWKRRMCRCLVGLLTAWPVVSSAFAQDVPRLPRVAPSDPDAARLTLRVAGDLEVQLAAAEPAVCDPVALDFDEFGRAFVVEMRGYSEAGEQGIGRVRRLVDRDRDGTLEQSVVFVDGLRNPTAIVCTRGGVLVGDAPQLLFLKDDDGDGRADSRVVLFEGFGTANIQQLLNNLQFGFDGKLYGASGGNPSEVRRVAEPWPFAQATVGPKEAATITLRGRDFVIDLRTGEIEATTGGGQFGQTFDGWGNRYVCSNSDHCQQIVIDDRELLANPLLRSQSLRVSISVEGPAAPIYRTSPVESWRVARTEMRIQGRAKGPIEGGGKASGYFSGATGICYYDGDGLPEEYRGTLFIGDAGSNLVHRKRLRDEALVKSAERVEQASEFLTSSDNWFRPVQLVNAPDGALWVLDMYREIVEHPASLPEPIKRQLDLGSGNDRGRLYRIVSKDGQFETRKLPGEAASLDELVAMLGHANGWHRRTAARLLRERDEPAAREALERWLVQQQPADARLAALYLLKDWGRLTDEQLRSVLEDAQPNLRVHGLRLAVGRSGEEWDQLRLRLLTDDDQRVRVAAAFSLAGSTDRNVAADFARMAYLDVEDFWTRLAVLSSAVNLRAELLEQYTHSIVGEIRGEDFAFLDELSRQIAASGKEQDGRRLVAVIESQCDARPALAIGLWSAATGGSPDRELQFNEWDLQAGKQMGDRLSQSLLERASALASDRGRAAAERARAIGLLARLPSDQAVPLWKRLFSDTEEPEIRRAALELAGSIKSKVIYEDLVGSLPQLSPELRSRAVAVLSASEESTRLLLDAVEAGAVPAVLVPASNRQQLQEHRDTALRERAGKLFASRSGGQREELIETTRRAIADLAGEREAGRVAFRKHCASCHRLENEGAEIGPSLVGYAYRTREDLLLHVLDPNREVDARYLAYSVQLADGRVLLGVIASENGATIELKTSTGESVVLNRAEVEEIRSTSKSLMPENLADELSPQVLADLSAYLQSLRN